MQTRAENHTDAAPQPQAERRLPLADIRVVDVTMGWAGPTVTHFLGDMGAEVIKIEAVQRYDWWRMMGMELKPGAWERRGGWNTVNRNKLGITLDLTRPDGVRLCRELVAVGDILVENYRAGVVERFGLGYETLRAINPSIVMLSMPAFGMSGPWRDYVGFGNNVEQLSGLPAIMGYENGRPTVLGTGIPDPVAGFFGTLAAIVALRQRRRTGRGQLIDLSQLEALTRLVGEHIVAFSMNRREPRRIGNRHAFAAPHGVYQCKGDDSWISIAVYNDAQWRALCAEMGHSEWADDARFADSLSRFERQDEMDRLIGEWTKAFEHRGLMTRLQNVGVPAGAAYAPQELLDDPQLQARGFWQMVTREHVGTKPHPGMYFKLSRTPGRIRLPAPTMGQHNALILGELLGVAQNEIARLEREKIIGTEPLNPF